MALSIGNPLETIGINRILLERFKLDPERVRAIATKVATQQLVNLHPDSIGQKRIEEYTTVNNAHESVKRASTQEMADFISQFLSKPKDTVTLMREQFNSKLVQIQQEEKKKVETLKSLFLTMINGNNLFSPMTLLHKRMMVVTPSYESIFKNKGIALEDVYSISPALASHQLFNGGIVIRDRNELLPSEKGIQKYKLHKYGEFKGEEIANKKFKLSNTALIQYEPAAAEDKKNKKDFTYWAFEREGKPEIQEGFRPIGFLDPTYHGFKKLLSEAVGLYEDIEIDTEDQALLTGPENMKPQEDKYARAVGKLKNGLTLDEFTPLIMALATQKEEDGFLVIGAKSGNEPLITILGANIMLHKRTPGLS